MIGFGIIGRNFIVDMMLAAMAEVPEVRPAGIYSRSQADAEAFRDAHGMDFACSDLDELGRDSRIDAVYIASPNSCHFSQAKRMLECGKHVLCEKPACSNSAQVRELVHLAEEKGLVFLEGMRPVFGEPLRLVRENLPKIGKLRQVRFEYCKPSSRLQRFRSGEAVNTFDPALSNAAVMDLGVYGIHSIIHLFGKPETVSAAVVHLENGFEACGTVLMQYPGFVAEAAYSKIHRMDQPSVLAGEEGMICLDRPNNTERVWLESNDGTVTDLGYQPTLPNDMVHELRAFCRFVNEGIRPEKENETSILTARVLDEVRYQTGTKFPADQ